MATQIAPNRNSEPTSEPSGTVPAAEESPIEAMRRTMLESVRSQLVRHVTNTYIESLSTGGAPDPFNAVWDHEGDLSKNPYWNACYGYIKGVSDALNVKPAEVLALAYGHIQRNLPDPVIHAINMRRRRRGLSFIREPWGEWE